MILDTGGAESLLGDGDMLFHPYSSSKMLRVQGAFISSEEMELITGHWRAQAAPEYREDLLQSATGDSGEGAAAATAATPSWPRPSPRSCAPAPPRSRCCSAACGWATRGPGA